MSLLKPASRGSYVKAGFLGFNKSGKTHTAMELAIGIREHFKLDGPIAMFDSEKGSEYWTDRVRERTGKDLLVVKSRSLVDLMATVDECIALGVAALVADSMTHVWREVCDAYHGELRAAARRKGWREPDRLEFQDWGKIKSKWATWPDRYLNAPLHIIVCGRAGFEYDMQEDERGKKELVKTGVKMKTEGEFGFEPSLLVEMAREWNSVEPPEMVARATVIGDRFDILNGKTCDNPTFEFFRPFVELLRPAEHTIVDTTIKTSFGLDETRADNWKREKDRREILAEKIAAAFTLAGMDGRGADDKKVRTELMSKYFGSTSWKEISERTPSAAMQQGLRRFETDHGLLGDDVEFSATPDQQTEGQAAGPTTATPADSSAPVAAQTAEIAQDATASAGDKPDPEPKKRGKAKPEGAELKLVVQDPAKA